MVIVLDFWLTCIVLSWGLYSPRNATALTALFITALSLSAAILLIVELYSPYTGMLRVSSVPLRLAYETLVQSAAIALNNHLALHQCAPRGDHTQLSQG